MVAIFLADGFEMIEALTPCDILKRAGLDVRLVSLGKEPFSVSTHKVKVTTDMVLSQIDPQTLDMIILPGGMPGADNLFANDALMTLVKNHAKADKPTAAICAAPYILGRLGLLKGRKATCYPGFEGALDGAEVLSQGVVRDGNILTAKGMGVSLPFALEATKMLCGEDKAAAVAASVMAQ